ncbi:MAG: hypothetical protein WD738_11080 [Pirellulales bacterium]
MCRACISAAARVALALTTATLLLVIVEPVAAQEAFSSGVPPAMYPLIGPEARGAAIEQVALGRSTHPALRGPLARLVTNPDSSAGQPPFALTDQTGTIQRYVEPVPGIDLAPYVGQVVVVRHDTGRTLLASQLDLPPRPLYPMVGASQEAASSSTASDSPHLDGGGRRPQVQQAQYADSDDTTVELLGEGEVMAGGNAVVGSNPMPGGMAYPEGGYPVFPGESMVPGGPGFAAPGCDPMQSAPAGMEWFPSDFGGGGPCPQCGRYHAPAGYDAVRAPGSAFSMNQGQPTHIFAEVEINFLRAHIMEDALDDKLSEKYEFSPRFIVGFTDLGPLSGRVRYWTYDRQTQTLDDSSIRLEFDVFDVEGTHLFAGRRSEVMFSAGLRLARIELTDDDDEEAGTDLVGITLAADGRTALISFDAGRVAWVYGGRLSILGGDWGGDDDHELIDHRIRDDNVVVHELHAGLEYARCYRKIDLHAQLGFEMQNWHSDVLAEDADVDSIGFIGPGVRLGAQY